MPLQFVAILLCVATLLPAAISRSVEIDVQAPWERHSLSFISELSEFLHDQQPRLFWQFADGMCQADNAHRIQGVATLQRHLQQLRNSTAADDATVQEQKLLLQEAVAELHHSVFAMGTSLIPSTLHTLTYSMVGLGQYSPAVQFFKSLLPLHSLHCQEPQAAHSQQRKAIERAFVVVQRGPGEPGTVLCDAAALYGQLQSLATLPPGTAPPDLILQSTMGGRGAAWDHNYSGSQGDQQHAKTGVTAVLYGMIGLPDFCQLYASLQEAAAAGLLDSFSVRHSTPTAAALPNRHDATPLQGFGVFLDIKNMEYKNVDDSKSADAQQDTSADADAPTPTFADGEEVLGVNFANLLRTHGEGAVSSADLAILREELRELEFQQNDASAGGGGSGSGSGGSDDGSMKVWKMRDLGLQTLQSIYSAAVKNTAADAMKQFADIVTNFPMLAPRISSTKVSAKVRSEVEEWFISGVGHMIPQNCVLLNGKFMDLSGSTFNVFNFLSNIRKELDITSKLAALSLSAEGKKRVLQIAQNVGKEESDDEDDEAFAGRGINKKFDKNSGPIRVDISKGGKYVVNFFNNIEKDPQYQGMQRSLKQLLYPSWSIVPIGRNLYTLISIVDPLSVPGAGILMQMYMMMEQQYPVRFGAVFTCSAPTTGGSSPLPSPTASSPAADTLNEDFCRLFAHLKDEYSQMEATQFAVTVASQILEQAEADTAVAADVQQDGSVSTADKKLSRDDLKRSYVISVVSAGAASMMRPAGSSKGPPSEAAVRAEADKVLSDHLHTDFIQNSTAYLEARGLPINSYSLNGILSNDDNLGGSVMQQLMREQQHVIRLLRYRRISDRTKSLFSAILANSRTYSRYHAMLDEQTPEYVDFSDSEASSLLQNLTWIDSGDAVRHEAGAGASVLSSSAILLLPPTRAGFAAAASALRFVAATARSTNATSGSDAEHDGERIAFVVDVDAALRAPSSEETAASALIGDLVALIGRSKSSDEWHATVAQLQRLLEMLAEGKALDAAAADLLGGLAAANLETVTDELSSLLKSSGEMGAQPAAGHVSSHRARTLKRLAGVSAASGADAAGSDCILMIYNGRKLLISNTAPDSAFSGRAPLLEDDVELLAALEKGRIHNKLKQSWNSLWSPAASAAGASSSDHLLRIASYCGNYNTVGGANRIDVRKYLAMIGIVEGATNSMVFHIEPAAFTFAEDNDDLEIFFIVDPLSVAGQRASALIEFVQEHLQYAQTVVLVPSREISDFPLQNFYRFVVSPEQAIAVDSQAGASAAVAKFDRIPRQHTLTVRMDTPEPWNVQSRAAVQDIDNLRCTPALCGDPGTGARELTSISYALKNVLVSGQCFEGAGASGRVSLPPTGLQLTLAPMQRYHAAAYNSSHALAEAADKLEHSDTLVMQNLGYYQLQANPGLYVLNLAAGRATELYTIDNFDDPTASTSAAASSSALPSQTTTSKDVLMGGQLIAVRTFENDIHRLVVNKRPGMEHLSILEDADDDDEGIKRYGQRTKRSKGKKDESGKGSSGSKGSKGEEKKGMWSSLFGSSPKGGDDGDDDDAAAGARKLRAGGEQEEEDDRIHVFSLATGHVYERLLRIMMLSVSRQTSKPVKFWLFENYLSPTFKQSVSAMEKEFGFEVAYVTYKWPQWLTQQTQQQRIIWGYKILFLDVLFPLSVKKVIYVDADQVVRADLKELWDMDLQGKPYGYTPFCSSREETLGFQFWRQGYWKDHLRGLPYHISALYVVDLQKFRRNAIGDTLRATYDRLSRDPNSLANLDQDLPNFAQHQVPIFSLPQEWLWCETWCSDETKAEAKTIDLCNNPMHKEPKLDMARRIISGSLFNNTWVELDEEIKAVQLRHGLVSLQGSD